jgi:NAD(P)H dehydrogenase (quinone)
MRCRFSAQGLRWIARAVLAICAGVCQAAEPVKVLIAYVSQTGHTEKMARAAAEGVGQADAEAVLRRVTEVTKQDLVQADGIMLGSPVHMGDVAAEMRTALVAWSGGEYGFWSSRALQDKVGAVFATGGAPSNGKEFTMISMALGLLQYGVVLVTPYGGVGASATTGIPEMEKGVDERELMFIGNGEGGVFAAAGATSFASSSCSAQQTITVLGQLQFGTLESVNHVSYRDGFLFVAAGLGGIKVVDVSTK